MRMKLEDVAKELEKMAREISAKLASPLPMRYSQTGFSQELADINDSLIRQSQELLALRTRLQQMAAAVREERARS